MGPPAARIRHCEEQGRVTFEQLPLGHSARPMPRFSMDRREARLMEEEVRMGQAPVVQASAVQDFVVQAFLRAAKRPPAAK